MKKLPWDRERKLVLGLILLAVASRLLPHPPNFAPITGIALFATARLNNRLMAILVPFVAMLLSDIVLGFSAITFFVYMAFGAILLLGFQTKKVNIATVILSSLLFFFLTNLGVWVLHYPKTWEALTSCFILAIPFYTNTLIGDLFYAFVLFGSFTTIKQYYLKTV